MITTTEERPHPLITALTAANAGQGGLNEAVADAVDIIGLARQGNPGL